jgi:hypothetical protein
VSLWLDYEEYHYFNFRFRNQFQRIIDCIDNGEIRNAKVNLVIADRECFGLERAEKHNIPNQLIKRGKDFSENLEKQFRKYRFDCSGRFSIDFETRIL